MTLHRLAVLATAAALALGPLAATPARANDDLAKAILGAAALYVIIDKIEDDRRNDDRAYRDQGRDYGRDYGRDDRWNDRRDRRLRAIPANCIRSVETRRGPYRLVGEDCARRQGLRNLPDRCEVSYRGPRDRGDAYGLRCLMDAGYRVEGRRRD